MTHENARKLFDDILNPAKCDGVPAEARMHFIQCTECQPLRVMAERRLALLSLQRQPMRPARQSPPPDRPRIIIP